MIINKYVDVIFMFNNKIRRYYFKKNIIIEFFKSINFIKENVSLLCFI